MYVVMAVLGQSCLAVLGQFVNDLWLNVVFAVGLRFLLGAAVFGDELFGQPTGFIIVILNRRGFHEVPGWAEQRPADAAIFRQLGSSARRR